MSTDRLQEMRERDGLGHDLFQTWLEVCYANYIRTSTRNLIGFVYRSSPLLRSQRERRVLEEPNET